MGLTQEQAGRLIRVQRETLCDWENCITEPTIEFYPVIIKFLGYLPFTFDESTAGGRVKQYRYMNGLSQATLGKKIGVGNATILRIEQGIGKPNNTTIEALKKLNIL